MSMRVAELIAADFTSPRDGVEEICGTKGVKTIPQTVDVGAVDMVLDVAGGGFAGVVLFEATTGSLAVAGVATKDFPVVGPVGLSLGGLSPLIQTNRQNARSVATHVQVVFNAAGLAAFLGKSLMFDWFVQSAAGTVGTRVKEEFKVVVVNRLTYRSIITPNDLLLVPESVLLGVTISVEDGTVYPAATVAALFSRCLLRKRGAELPK